LVFAAYEIGLNFTAVSDDVKGLPEGGLWLNYAMAIWHRLYLGICFEPINHFINLCLLLLWIEAFGYVKLSQR
jgi:hypothetical protein